MKNNLLISAALSKTSYIIMSEKVVQYIKEKSWYIYDVTLETHEWHFGNPFWWVDISLNRTDKALKRKNLLSTTNESPFFFVLFVSENTNVDGKRISQLFLNLFQVKKNILYHNFQFGGKPANDQCGAFWFLGKILVFVRVTAFGFSLSFFCEVYIDGNFYTID